MSRNLIRKYFICCQISENFHSNSILNWSKTDLLSGRADFISRKHVVTAVRYQNKLWYVIADNNSNVIMGPKPFKNLLQFLFTNLILQYLIKDEIKKVRKYPVKTTEDGKTLTTFYYCPVNHQSGLQRNIFSKLLYIRLIHQNLTQIMSHHLSYMMVS